MRRALGAGLVLLLAGSAAQAASQGTLKHRLEECDEFLSPETLQQYPLPAKVVEFLDGTSPEPTTLQHRWFAGESGYFDFEESLAIDDLKEMKKSWLTMGRHQILFHDKSKDFYFGLTIPESCRERLDWDSLDSQDQYRYSEAAASIIRDIIVDSRQGVRRSDVLYKIGLADAFVEAAEERYLPLHLHLKQTAENAGFDPKVAYLAFIESLARNVDSHAGCEGWFQLCKPYNEAAALGYVVPHPNNGIPERYEPNEAKHPLLAFEATLNVLWQDFHILGGGYAALAGYVAGKGLVADTRLQVIRASEGDINMESLETEIRNALFEETPLGRQINPDWMNACGSGDVLGQLNCMIRYGPELNRNRRGVRFRDASAWYIVDLMSVADSFRPERLETTVWKMGPPVTIPAPAGVNHPIGPYESLAQERQMHEKIVKWMPHIEREYEVFTADRIHLDYSGKTRLHVHDIAYASIPDGDGVDHRIFRDAEEFAYYNPHIPLRDAKRGRQIPPHATLPEVNVFLPAGTAEGFLQSFDHVLEPTEPIRYREDGIHGLPPFGPLTEADARYSNIALLRHDGKEVERGIIRELKEEFERMYAQDPSQFRRLQLQTISIDLNLYDNPRAPSFRELRKELPRWTGGSYSG